MSITKVQADIIRGMVSNLMHDYHRYMHNASLCSPQSNIAMNTFAENFHFSQRRLKVYLELLVNPLSDEAEKD